MVTNNELISHASKGLIREYNQSVPSSDTSAGSFEFFPDFDRETALSDIRKDDTVKAGIITLTDKSMEYGNTISSEDNKSNLKSFEETKKKVRFDKILRKIFSNLYGYQNVFVENVKDGNSKVKELHILETTQTQPEGTENGEITGYIQKVTGFQVKDYPHWAPEEVTHISIDDLSETIWSDIAIESIHKYVLLKQYIYTYYGWFFGTNQKRNLLNIKEASEDSVKELLMYLKKLEVDITKHVPFAGELEKVPLGDINDADKALAIIDKCDSNILKLMQVPSIAANETGSSNRSSGDKQDDFLITRIKSVHRAVEEALMNDLFIKMGYPKIIIKFNNPYKTNIEKILQNAERMKTIGFKLEKVEAYLLYEGFPVSGKLIDEEVFKPEQPDMTEGANPKSEDMQPSRQRKAEDVTSKNIGTGDAASTRKDQLVGHSITFSKKRKDFNSYPYTL